MKIIITENRQKEILKKVWDKTGPTLDKHILKMVNVSFGNAKKWFIEYVGIDNIKKIVEDILKVREYRIENCGTYNFDFEIFDYSISQIDDDITLTLGFNYDGKRGVVTIGDEEMSLNDATWNEDYGWEVESEIDDCVYDFLYKELKIFDKTGLNIQLERI